jgi:hypothetical protein
MANHEANALEIAGMTAGFWSKQDLPLQLFEMDFRKRRTGQLRVLARPLLSH